MYTMPHGTKVLPDNAAPPLLPHSHHPHLSPSLLALTAHRQSGQLPLLPASSA